MTFLFMATFNLLFMELRGGILNLDLSYNSLVHYAALTPRVSAFLSIPDAEFDILNIFIRLIFWGMHYHLRWPSSECRSRCDCVQQGSVCWNTAAITQQSPGKGAVQGHFG